MFFNLNSLSSITQSFYSHVPKPEWLPSYLSFPFSIFHYVHRTCFWRREIKHIYGSQRKAFTYWSSVAAHHITLHIPILNGTYSGAAHAALIGRRHLACIKQYRVFSKSVRECKGIFKFDSSQDLKVNFNLLTYKGFRFFFFVDPFTEILMRHRAKQAFNVFSKISIASREALKLSHRIIEFVEAFSFDPQNTHARCRFFNNVDALIQKLVANPEKQKRYIQENQEFINYFFARAHIPYTAAQLIPAAETVHKTTKIFKASLSMWMATADTVTQVLVLPYTLVTGAVRYFSSKKVQSRMPGFHFTFIQ
jgi:hypothetical protein